MKMQIKEFADFTGVSVRTLHYYDEIGLLKPSKVDGNNGYRFYDESSILRMQEILFYRELDFPLKSISDILSSPDYDKQKALKEQKKLLTLKKERLERLIEAVDKATKGDIIMDAFKNTDFEQYKDEVKERWGQTESFTEYTEKSKGYTKDTYNALSDGMNEIFKKFTHCMNDKQSPSSDEAQGLVKKLQNFITDNFYKCTNNILVGLGQMYVADERFKNNIDKHGTGTADFVSKAIEFYCK